MPPGKSTSGSAPANSNQRSASLRIECGRHSTENTETDLTLEKAVQLAQAHESARQETYALRGDTRRHAPATQPETAFVVKRQPHAGSGKAPTTPGAEKECYRCGGKGHHPDKCWNKTRECHVCHKKGHIARACRSKNMKLMKSSSTPSWKNTKGTKAQTTYEVEEEEVCSLYALSSKQAVKVNMEVAGQELELIVDTGASVAVIPEEIYKKDLWHVKLQKSTTKLESYCGKSLKVIGEARVPITYENQTAMERFVVVDASNKPAVMGRNWLNKIQLDWTSLFNVEMKREKGLDPPAEFPDLFQERMGKLKGFQAKISLSSDASLRFHKPRPVPFALQAKVDEEIDRLVKEDVLRPVEQSAWTAPVVVVRKGDGSIRLCGDYKVTINPCLENNQYATPNAQDLFATLAGGRKFTRLDLKQAYLQMEVEPESQPYLTINTRKGLFTFNRMPFGIRTAPSIWQKAMDMILTGIPGVYRIT